MWAVVKQGPSVQRRRVPIPEPRPGRATSSGSRWRVYAAPMSTSLREGCRLPTL